MIMSVVITRGLKRHFSGDRLVQLLPLSVVVYAVTSLDKALLDNYLCLVTSNKQQINREVKESTGKIGIRKLLVRIRPNITQPSLYELGKSQKINRKT